MSSQTKYIRAKLPPVEGNAILLVRETMESEPEIYLPKFHRSSNGPKFDYEDWRHIGGYLIYDGNQLVKRNGKSVYWSLLRYE